jgi:ATP-independent RNA helicase DbpA
LLKVKCKMPLKSVLKKLPTSLQEVLSELGFTTLTPIQEQSIPLLLEGRDLIGQSQTGSGKTLAFGLPILSQIKVKKRYVQALIVCPTRELCAQVAREIRRAGRREKGLQVLVLAGGQPSGPQRAALEKGAHIAVGTPGRLLDLLQRSLDVSFVRTVVLDEADRMLDMGFQEDMEILLGAIPKERQTVLFSATFPESIDEMSRKFQVNPARINVAAESVATAKIQEFVWEASPSNKHELVLSALQHYEPANTLVFCNQKVSAAELAQKLQDSDVSTASLHGDLEQFDRDRVMARFRNGSIRVLVATDVASRGIDIEGLDLVINYDIPHKPEIYVHRIGRTGRAGKSGLAVMFMTSRERHKIDEIEAFIGRTLQMKGGSSIPQLSESPKKAEALMKTFSISGGRKDKLRPGDILGALTGEAGGLDASDVGKIEIHDHHAYVAVSIKVAKKAFEALSSGQVKGRKFKVEVVG